MGEGIRTASVATTSAPGHTQQRYTPLGKCLATSTGHVSTQNSISLFQCEPTLLPEPNHVMLNHLYALSIKDGVMVLSATHRYRKKYVTTLLYKPI